MNAFTYVSLFILGGAVLLKIALSGPRPQPARKRRRK